MGLFTSSQRTKLNINGSSVVFLQYHTFTEFAIQEKINQLQKKLAFQDSFSSFITFFEKFKSKKLKIAVNISIYWDLQGLKKS